MPDDQYPDGFPSDLEPYYDALVRDGRSNPAIAAALEERGRLPVQEENCLLCTPPTMEEPLETEDGPVRLLYKDEDCYVVDLTVTKGHDVRTLVAIHEHGGCPADVAPYRETLLAETAAAVEDGYVGVYGRGGSFSGHWHLVGFDLPGDDLEGIHDVALYRVEDGVYDPDPVWVRSEPARSASGEHIFYDGL